jgi:hypothetical protein
MNRSRTLAIDLALKLRIPVKVLSRKRHRPVLRKRTPMHAWFHEIDGVNRSHICV